MTDNVIELIVKTTDNASAQIKGIASQIGSLTGTTELLTTAIAAVGAGFTLDKLIESITSAQVATADLDRQFAQFGSTVGVSEQDMIDFAETTSKATTLTSESLKEAQANLLNYTSITGKSFEDARNLVVDLAAKMGGDAAQAAELLGRALQNPVSGIRLLAQVGVTLTNQQKETIASLTQTGQSAQAVSFIMAELQQRVTGTAQALAGTLGGALTQLKNSFGNAFTGTGADVEGLTGSIKSLNDQVNDPKFQAGVQALVALIVELGRGVADIVGFTGGIFKDFAPPQTLIEDLEQTKTSLEQLIAVPDQDPGAVAGYIADLKRIEAELKALKTAAQDDIDLAPIVISSNAKHLGSPPPLFDPLQRPITLGPNAQHADADSGPLANPFLPVPIIQQYLADTESAYDKGLADFQTHVQERKDLVMAGLLEGQTAVLQNNSEFQKLLDANFAPIRISATKIGGALDDIDKEGQQVAQDLTGAFTSFFESGSLSIRTFGQDFIKVIDQIFAKAISTDIVGALGLGRLFDQPNTTTQFGGLLGAIGGIFGANNGGSGTTLTGEFAHSNLNSDDTSSLLDTGLGALFGFAGGGQVGGGPIVVGEDGPEIFTPGVSGTVMNQRQLAFQGGGGASGLVYSPVNNINLTTDNSDKNTAELLQFLTAQQQNQQKEFERKLARNGYKIR